jgi:hypothetical protein
MKEINCLVSIWVLKWQPLSKWALPSFIIPKKDYTVRTISNFRELNKWIVRKPYPIPKISTTLQEWEGFTYATTLDLNMGYIPTGSTPQPPRCALSYPLGVNTLIRGYQWDLPDRLTFSKQKWGT